MKTSVSPKFREYVLDKYPQLLGEPAHLRFFLYLCFGNFFDDKTGHLVVPSKVLAEDCCLKKWDRHFNGKAFLRELQNVAFPELTWTEHESFPADSWHGKARTIKTTGFDEELTRAIREESLSPSKSQVDFVTGAATTDSSIYAARRSETEKYEQDLEHANLNATQTAIVNYLRRLEAGHLFLRQITRNKTKIEQAINELPAEVQAIQYQVLGSVHQNPNVYYFPSEQRRTCRLSPRGSSVLGLKGSVRKALCSGWVDCDLRSSQFAILAAKLAAPRSQELIANGENLWSTFYEHTHGTKIEPPPALKKQFKEAIYSLCFGKSTANLSIMLNDQGLAKLLSHPIIQELLTLREDWFKQIRNEGGAYDVWGEWQLLDLTRDPDTKKSRRWAGAVAASVIQSFEMEIIAPIFDIALRHGRAQQFGICLFQHDGACISFQSKSKRPKAEQLLKEAVEARALELGICTSLEFKQL